jgi:hypothetical protein
MRSSLRLSPHEEKISDALATYLHDHLAGSLFAVKLLSSLSDQYEDEELGAFARAPLSM